MNFKNMVFTLWTIWMLATGCSDSDNKVKTNQEETWKNKIELATTETKENTQKVILKKELTEEEKLKRDENHLIDDINNSLYNSLLTNESYDSNPAVSLLMKYFLKYDNNDFVYNKSTEILGEILDMWDEWINSFLRYKEVLLSLKEDLTKIDLNDKSKELSIEIKWLYYENFDKEILISSLDSKIAILDKLLSETKTLWDRSEWETKVILLDFLNENKVWTYWNFSRFNLLDTCIENFNNWESVMDSIDALKSVSTQIEWKYTYNNNSILLKIIKKLLKVEDKELVKWLLNDYYDAYDRHIVWLSKELKDNYWMSDEKMVYILTELNSHNTKRWNELVQKLLKLENKSDNQ